MKRFFIFLVALALLAPVRASLAAPVAGDLIKASGQSVYYYGPDGKRYVFPTEKTYFSWYADFSSVRSITDAELAAIPIGGNVTYRPGVRMVKVTTDPRTYAIDADRTLRWVESEAAAIALYGSSWAQKIDDLPDPFFVNYKLGTSITSDTDYNAAVRTAAATSIAIDRGLTPATPTPTPTPAPVPTPTPTPTPTHTGSLSASKTTASANEVIDLYANASPSASLDSVRILLDGILERECTYSPCAISFRMPSAKSVYEAVAEFHWITGERVTSTVSIAVQAGIQAGLTLTVTNPEVRPGGPVEIIASADNSFIAYTIDIYLDGNNVKGCGSAQECRYLDTAGGAIGTTHQTYAVFGDRSGTQTSTAVKNFRVVENPSPNVTIELGKNILLRGESVDVTVRASDDSGLQNTQIWQDGALVKTCLSTLCTAVVGPFNQAGTFNLIGRATDSLGKIGEATSTGISVQ